MLIPPKQILVQSLLYSHLSNADNEHFFDSQMEKNLSKATTTKPYPAKKYEKYIRNNA